MIEALGPSCSMQIRAGVLGACPVAFASLHHACTPILTFNRSQSPLCVPPLCGPTAYGGAGLLPHCSGQQDDQQHWAGGQDRPPRPERPAARAAEGGGAAPAAAAAATALAAGSPPAEQQRAATAAATRCSQPAGLCRCRPGAAQPLLRLRSAAAAGGPKRARVRRAVGRLARHLRLTMAAKGCNKISAAVGCPLLPVGVVQSNQCRHFQLPCKCERLAAPAHHLLQPYLKMLTHSMLTHLPFGAGSSRCRASCWSAG